MGENSIERDTQALIRGGNSPKRWTQRANSSQIAGCGTGEREAPGGNRTAIGAVLLYRLSGDWGVGMVLEQSTVLLTRVLFVEVGPLELRRYWSTQIHPSIWKEL